MFKSLLIGRWDEGRAARTGIKIDFKHCQVQKRSFINFSKHNFRHKIWQKLFGPELKSKI